MVGDNANMDPLAWAIQRLTRSTYRRRQGVISGSSCKTRSPDDRVVRQWAVVERILARYLPDWKARVRRPMARGSAGTGWHDHSEVATLYLAVIEGQEEVEGHLADRGPPLTAAQLHPRVREAARPAWDTDDGHSVYDRAA
jgi:hypothetical protein